MARKIVITSGKGGVGKTTLCASLGYALSQLNQKTLLVDMDFGLNNLDIIMGIENKIVYDVIDVIEGKCLPKDAFIRDFVYENLYTFPSTHSFCKVKFGINELSAIIKSFENDFDFILIDCPAGIDGGFRRAIGCADEYIVVTTPHLSAIRDADKTISYLKSMRVGDDNNSNNKKVNLVINRVRTDLINGGDMLDPMTIVTYLNANLLGVIMEDDCIAMQSYHGGVLDEKSNAYKSIRLISNNLAYGTNEIYDYSKNQSQKKSIWNIFCKKNRV